MKKWYALGSAPTMAAVCVALLAGCVAELADKDDIRRFRRIRNM